MTPEEIYQEELREAVEVRTAADCEDSDEKHCRFCWSEEENSIEDPLILACKCRGSVGLIHYSCLKNWIASQRQMKQYSENVTSYYWKKFECEICK